MMSPHGFAHGLGIRYVSDEKLPDLHVPFDDGPLCRLQPLWSSQHVLRHPDLTHVVEQTRYANGALFFVGQPQSFGHANSVGRHLFGMPAGVTILVVYGRYQPLQDGEGSPPSLFGFLGKGLFRNHAPPAALAR